MVADVAQPFVDGTSEGLDRSCCWELGVAARDNVAAGGDCGDIGAEAIRNHFA